MDGGLFLGDREGGGRMMCRGRERQKGVCWEGGGGERERERERGEGGGEREREREERGGDDVQRGRDRRGYQDKHISGW